MNAGDTLALFNEQANGNNLTDYSSDLHKITIPSESSHVWVEATCTEPRTCSVCGATEGEPLGHTWTDATCTEPKTCSVCGATEGNARGHSWDDGKVTKEATCEEKGERTFTCRNDSSHTKTEEIAALGHDWSDWKVTKEPTDKEKGERERVCNRCEKKETEAIDSLKSFKVTFDSRGGSAIAAQTVLENKTAEKPADPTRDGFTFTGWFADGECKTAFDFKTLITADTPDTPDDNDAPDKTDGKNPLLWLIAIPIVAAGGAAGFFLGRKRRR